MPETVFLICVFTDSSTLVGWFSTKDFIHRDSTNGNNKIIMLVYSAILY